MNAPPSRLVLDNDAGEAQRILHWFSDRVQRVRSENGNRSFICNRDDLWTTPPGTTPPRTLAPKCSTSPWIGAPLKVDLRHARASQDPGHFPRATRGPH